ncbi:MAG: HprK-related kinase A [Burkholderiales bacterium]|nr:HprK-related kinase A [Burkholderiales bacterium]MDE1925714.1 HprK-related kinase A [Burkholderiales bacterium]MDE2503660.1 HprK-related kinase A [Burkholderiales bacterium]
MILGQLAADDVSDRLRSQGLGLRTGPFQLRVRSDVAAVRDGLCLLYAEYPVVDADDFCDYAVDISRPRGVRRWVRPQVLFRHDHRRVYEPMPVSHAMPLVEWSLNWCIGAHSHQFLCLHAAAIEREGCAAILPAPPGSGKSTLCAALVGRGWRLLSDELALVALDDHRLHGLARPVSLKNRSIEIIQAYIPSAVFSVAAHATAKGTVAHMRAPSDAVARVGETARPRWVVFPRYVAAAEPSLLPRAKADAMQQLARNAFNSGVTGRAGFHALADLVDDCDCYDFSYSRLDDAVAVFDDLVRRR